MDRITIVQSSIANKAAVCPTQGSFKESWSVVTSQVLERVHNLAEQQSQSSNESNTSTEQSMRKFTSVMLKAWRRRRADVQRLQAVVEQLKASSMHTKNELHVCNTLMRVEQNHCRELQVELKKSNLSINQVRNSCEMLNTSVISLTADKQQLERDLSQSRTECRELTEEIRKSKDDLLASIVEQRNLQQLLANEQRKTNQLLREKEKLLDELFDLRNRESEFVKKEEAILQQLEQKDNMLLNMRTIIEGMQINRSRQYPNQWNPAINEQGVQEPKQETELSVNPIFQLESFKTKFSQFVKYYGIDHIYKKVYYYTVSAAYLLWFVLLPNKSLRNGCMPLTIRFSQQ